MGRTYALIRLTIAEAIRTRLALAFILMIVGIYVLLVTTATGDGTVAGKVQMFLSHSIGLTHLLLSLLVAFLGCRSIDQDIKTQRIDSLVTKPLSRWQFLLGRWMGLVILTAGLLAVSMAASYVIAVFVFAPQAQADPGDEFKLENQVLVARKAFKPAVRDMSKEIEQHYKRLQQEGRLPEGMAPSEIRKTIEEGLIRRDRTVPPRYTRVWWIRGLPTPKEGDVLMTLRFKYEPSITTSGSAKYGLHSNTVLGQWFIGNKERMFATPPTQKPYRTPHEIDVDVNAIDSDGTLRVAFRNLDPRGVAVHFPLEDGLEVLVRTGSFTPNFIRTVLIMFLTLVFLGTLALAAGTFLSFPIAALVTIAALFVGLAGNFLSEAIGLPWGLELKGNILQIAEKLITLAALKLVPVLDVAHYSDKLIAGRLVSWGELLWKTVSLLGKSCLLAVLAVIIFSRRELGRVIV